MMPWPVKSEKGAAFLWVVGITTLVMLLGTVYIYMVAADSRTTNSYVNGVRAYYLAESGAELVISQLYNKVKTDKILPGGADLLGSISILISNGDGSYTGNNPFQSYSSQYNDAHKFTVKVIVNSFGNLNDYTILSSGAYGTAVRCMMARLEIRDNGDTFEFLPDKWHWEQISRDEFNRY